MKKIILMFLIFTTIALSQNFTIRSLGNHGVPATSDMFLFSNSSGALTNLTWLQLYNALDDLTLTWSGVHTYINTHYITGAGRFVLQADKAPSYSGEFTNTPNYDYLRWNGSTHDTLMTWRQMLRLPNTIISDWTFSGDNTFGLGTTNLFRGTVTFDGATSVAFLGLTGWATGSSLLLPEKFTITTWRHLGYIGSDGASFTTFNYGTSLTDTLMTRRQAWQLNNTTLGDWTFYGVSRFYGNVFRFGVDAVYDAASTMTINGMLLGGSGANWLPPSNIPTTFTALGYTGSDGSGYYLFNYGVSLTDTLSTWRHLRNDEIATYGEWEFNDTLHTQDIVGDVITINADTAKIVADAGVKMNVFGTEYFSITESGVTVTSRFGSATDYLAIASTGSYTAQTIGDVSLFAGDSMRITVTNEGNVVIGDDAGGSLNKTKVTIYDAENKIDVIADSMIIGGDLDVEGDLNVDGIINGVKVYRALITQSSTAAPTATVLENTLGAVPVWTRTSAGLYITTLSSAFTADKTFLLIGKEEGSSFPHNFFWTSANVVTVWTHNSSGGREDDKLSKTSVEIRVYP